MTPKKYLEFKQEKAKEVIALERLIEDARDVAKSCSPPDSDSMRPATASDIKEGALIWHKSDSGEWHWEEVLEVHRPEDSYKAYTADDGSRYGLSDAWVEVA